MVDGVVTDEIDYLTADDELLSMIAQANAPSRTTTEASSEEQVSVAAEDTPAASRQPILVAPDEIDYMDVSARQMVSVATALIPFLEHDDANRALMGANMQRQAVPLLQYRLHRCVGTGMEYVRRDRRRRRHRRCKPGVDHRGGGRSCHRDERRRLHDHLSDHEVPALQPGQRLQPAGALSTEGDRVEVGSRFIADGPSTEYGELALGKNLLVAFMSWEGYNFEDAIILSQRRGAG